LRTVHPRVNVKIDAKDSVLRLYIFAVSGINGRSFSFMKSYYLSLFIYLPFCVQLLAQAPKQSKYERNALPVSISTALKVNA